MGIYQQEKYKNYSLPSSKPLKSHAFYQEKVWTLPEQINKKLTIVAELLENLYPKLTDNFDKNTKVVIEKNLEILIKNLDLLQQDFHKNPDSFKTDNLKTNQRHITEMKNVCDNLQTVRSYEYEFKNLGKIKHFLHELEHLIQPTKFEKSLEKVRAKNKQKTTPAKKGSIKVKVMKKKEGSIVKSKKPVAKKTKPATKSAKQIKSKPIKKTSASVQKLKSPAKKVTKPKTKLPAKKVLKAKPASKLKSPAKKTSSLKK